MNFGECPYNDCDNFLMYSVPDRTPAYSELICEKCKRVIWYKFSRVTPVAYTEKDFLKEYNIDFENKIIEKRV